MEFNTRREAPTGHSLKVGLGEFKVLAINPTRDELNQVLGIESPEKKDEIEYMGENKKTGNTTCRITMWLQEVKTGMKTPLTFFVENADKVSQTGKLRYINAVGISSYVEDESYLQDWFKKAMTYRVAKEGEAELMEFLRNWLTGIELNTERGGNRNNILVDMSKVFKGNVRELSDLVHSEFAGTACCLATVKTKDTPDGTKMFQNIYNRAFLPGNCIRFFQKGNKKTPPKFVEKFINELKGENGPSDYFVVEELRDYKEGENPISTDAAIIQTDKPSY